MHALEIPEHQIGHGDREHNIPWRVFFPEGVTGGSVICPRFAVNSGVLNPDLLIKPYGREAASVWARARLRDRIDAVIEAMLVNSPGQGARQELRVSKREDPRRPPQVRMLPVDTTTHLRLTHLAAKV